MVDKKIFKVVFVLLGIFFGSFLCENISLASNGSGTHLNVYKSFLDLLRIDDKFTPLCSSVVTLLLCFFIGLKFRRSVETGLSQKDISPQGRFSLRTLVEMILFFLDEMVGEQCGKFYKQFFPLISSIFLFILISNLSGLIPGFPPVTENFSTNLVIGLAVFVCYNIAGIYEHGGAYAKQFAGPFLVLTPLFLVLETISHVARPLSLSVRLTANIYGDHLLLSIFSGLVPFLVPSFLMFFGLLVAVIQSFVFTTLTGIYVNMAIAHDH